MTNKEAIKILEKNKPTSDPRLRRIELCQACDMAITALQEPERKHGEWIYHGKADENNNISCNCSICHAGEVKSLDVIVPYCWKCGAIMDGKE